MIDDCIRSDLQDYFPADSYMTFDSEVLLYTVPRMLREPLVYMSLPILYNRGRHQYL